MIFKKLMKNFLKYRRKEDFRDKNINSPMPGSIELSWWMLQDSNL